ncbi:uncharacterized protein LOC125209547 [Salvia hispanica]|uniref:uncharacterized protein LOC125209547 n=1 Tax=Salvia hispanica TaxID=49212 RepID=UPI002008F40E|nr:uncharacterized protein LOC125209547 [Salvia hispanica]
MTSSRAGGSGGDASDSDNELDLAVQEAIDRLLRQRQQRRQQAAAALTTRLWIWHAYIGVAESNNDLNVLQSSPLFNDQCNGVGPAIGFVADDNQHNMGYYLADGIYPNWPVFVKMVKHAVGQKKSYFATRQEAVRKDVERAFGVLQSRWGMWTNEDDTGAGPSHGVATANVGMGVPHGEVERLRAFADMRLRDAHIRLQEDIVEEVWTRRGGR